MSFGVVLGPHNWIVTGIFEKGPQIQCTKRFRYKIDSIINRMYYIPKITEVGIFLIFKYFFYSPVYLCQSLLLSLPLPPTLQSPFCVLCLPATLSVFISSFIFLKSRMCTVACRRVDTCKGLTRILYCFMVLQNVYNCTIFKNYRSEKVSIRGLDFIQTQKSKILSPE